MRVKFIKFTTHILITMINSMGSKQIELLIIDATKSIETIEEEIQTFFEN